MTITFVELSEKLKRFDEVYLLEILNINSDDIVERFQDIIDERYDQLLQEVEDQ